MFPLGNLTKSQVKRIARESGMEYVVKKKESRGICFIGSRNFKKFISEVCPIKKKKMKRELLAKHILLRIKNKGHNTVNIVQPLTLESDSNFKTNYTLFL
jgi:hypothetical protein